MKQHKTGTVKFYKLKKNLLLILFTIVSMTQIIYAQEILTNESIIQMVELGFDDQTILTKINSSDYNFDTSISALSALKKGGVSPEIIDIVLTKSRFDNKKKTGIYFNQDDELVRVQPTIFAGTKSNRVAQKLVSGLINSKVKSILPGATSNNLIETRSPEFTFIFDPESNDRDLLQTGDKQDGDQNWYFKTASSPNEFVLLALKSRTKKNTREVTTGKSSALSSSSGFDFKGSIAFRIKETQSGKYIANVSNLEPGEYAFLYQGKVPQGRSNQIVFDFSIQ